jgi:hypothetical protein
MLLYSIFGSTRDLASIRLNRYALRYREDAVVRVVNSVLAIALAHLLIGRAHGQEVDELARRSGPRVYALLAAMGTQFSVVREVQTTGTHLSPYRRHTSQALNDALNRIALHGLDKAIAKIDPDSTRLYLSFVAPPMDGVAASQRESVIVNSILSQLQNVSQRMAWDRIVIAAPAYRAFEHDRIAGKQQGFGLFLEPLCQGGCGVLPGDTLGENGVESVTSEDKVVRARTFIAPFSYIGIWIVDARTLAVLDHQQAFDSQKLADDPHFFPGVSPGGLDLDRSRIQNYVLSRFSNVIESSVAEAVNRSEIAARRSKVDVGPIREVPADPEHK